MPTTLEKDILSEIFPKRSETAIILGLGPSLPNHLHIAREIIHRHTPIIFGVNRIFQANTGIQIDYYHAPDKRCWKHDIKSIRNTKALRYFIPSRYLSIPETTSYTRPESMVPIEFAKDPACFSTTWGEPLGHGYTCVYICMQLAVMQGAKTIHLFGVDMGVYPDGHKDSGKTHCYGGDKKREKAWKEGEKHLSPMQEKLESMEIKLEIHSDIFGKVGFNG